NCIIIENKINDAADRENQIGRYFKEREEIQRASVQAIVYLAKTPWKKLDREYSISDSGDREKIEKILIEIPVVNKEGESNFIDVLNECKNVCGKKLEAAASDNIPGIVESKALFPYVFLDEYISLLKHLGGGFMADDLDTQALYKIFSDKDTLDSFRVMGDLWEKRQEIIPLVFRDYFLKSLDFSVHPGDENAVFKKIKEDINTGFDTEFSFGFVYTPGSEIKRSNRIPFKELLEDVKLKKYFAEEEAIAQDEGWWIYKTVDWEKITCLDDLKTMAEEFEKLIIERL
ncbi:MAG: PD-(D/E)XK nuclease family protein, partial [Treponema sp.]|nr:PD-(D/E)XK nuclease family protein [Treponema sp.]